MASLILEHLQRQGRRTISSFRTSDRSILGSIYCDGWPPFSENSTSDFEAEASVLTWISAAGEDLISAIVAQRSILVITTPPGTQCLQIETRIDLYVGGGHEKMREITIYLRIAPLLGYISNGYWIGTDFFGCIMAGQERFLGCNLVPTLSISKQINAYQHPRVKVNISESAIVVPLGIGSNGKGYKTAYFVGIGVLAPSLILRPSHSRIGLPITS